MGEKKIEDLPREIQAAAVETLKNILSQVGATFFLGSTINAGFAVEEEPAIKLAQAVGKAFISLNDSLESNPTKIDDNLILYRIAEIIASQKNQD